MSIIGINSTDSTTGELVGKIIQYLMDSNVDKETFEYWYASNIYSVYQKVGNWKIKKFDDKLKDIVCLLIGCTGEELENEEFLEKELGEEWWYYFNKETKQLNSYI